MLPSPTAYCGEGMATAGYVYRTRTERALNRMCHTQEEVLRRLCYHAVADVQREENMCPQYVSYRKLRRTAGKRERMWRPTGSAANVDPSWCWVQTSEERNMEQCGW